MLPESEQDSTSPIIPLMSNSNFSTPEFGKITVAPFQTLSVKKTLKKPSYLPLNSIPTTHKTDYIKDFELISGTENLFPILLECSSTHTFICSKDCFIIMPISSPNEYIKVTLPEMPTCFKVHLDKIYLGLKSGLIIVYNTITKNTITTCEEFIFAVLQIEIVSDDTIIAMDLYGNLKMLKFSIKTFMDKIIKVSVSVIELVEQLRIKKRDKIKNLVKNLPFRSSQKEKDKPKYDPEEPQIEPIANQEPASQPQTPLTSKFAILPIHLRNSETYPIIYSSKSNIKVLTLETESNQKIRESEVSENISQAKNSEETEENFEIGMMELGCGGFTHSNHTHVILVMSICNRILYFRQIEVEGGLEFIKINEVEHTCKVFNGKFISNNLIVFLTENGVEISNTNSSLTFIQTVNYQKFSYLDFFNSELNFNFDKRLLYLNILKVTEDKETCKWYCLEGKRLMQGIIHGWKDYLNLMSEEFKWHECMKCSLMIYQEVITLLGGIPESIEERNEAMKAIFEKITLTYLSYSLKNVSQTEVDNQKTETEDQKETEEKQQIENKEETESKEETERKSLEENVDQVKEPEELKDSPKGKKEEIKSILYNVIDLMVRTDSFRYLFSTIYEAIKTYGLEKKFLEELEEFIECGSIKYMEEHILNKVINHYIETKKEKHKEYLEILIMSFDLSKMEKSLLLSICLTHQLYQSLIHICRDEKDYVTPIIKLCGLRLSILQNNQSLPLPTPISQQLSELTSITFHYLKECLLGHMTEFDNETNYIEMLEQIIRFFFIPSSLLMIMQSSPKMMFIIVNMIFGPTIMQYILENQHKFSIKNINIKTNPSSPTVSTTTTLDNTSQSIESLIWQEIHTTKYRYSNISKGNTKFMTNTNYFNIFNNYENSEINKQNQNANTDPQIEGDFNIYSNMITNIIYTVIQNYESFHNANTHHIIEPCNQINCETLETQSEKFLSELYLYHSHRFITYLILTNSFPIRLSYRILAFQFLIMYPTSFSPPSSDNILLQTSSTEKAEANSELTDDFRFINCIAIRVIDSIIRECDNFANLHEINSEQTKNKVLEYLYESIEEIGNKKHIEENSQNWNHIKFMFLTTKFYILDILNRYTDLISCFLQHPHNHVKRQVFTYLKSKITSHPSSFSIKSCIDLNLPQLLSLSPEKTLSLLLEVLSIEISNNIFTMIEIIDFCKKLEPYTENLLNFIEELIKCFEKLLEKNGDKQSELKISPLIVSKNIETLAIRHLETVLEKNKENLQSYVLRINYPLEEAFKVCEQCNDKTAMAYILIKSGRNLEGVMLISDLFAQCSRTIFKNLAKNIEVPPADIIKMDQQLDKILETCANEYALDLSKGEEMWEKICEKLFRDLNIKAIDSIPIVAIKEILQNYTNKIIEAMFAQVNSSFFINKFSNGKITGVPTKLYLQAYDLVQEKLGFTYEINSITKELTRISSMKMFNTLKNANNQGLSLSLTENCLECELPFNNIGTEEEQESQNIRVHIKLIMFNCGHTYHFNCYEQVVKNNKNVSNPSSPTKNKAGEIQACLHCKSEWDTIIDGSLGAQPDRYFLKTRERKKSILIERSKKLAEFDDLGYFKIQGEELLGSSPIVGGQLF